MWYDCAEMLPTDEEWKFVYSIVTGRYMFLKYNPYEGWYDDTMATMLSDKQYANHITHWLDQELKLPFPINRKLTEEEKERFSCKLKDQETTETT